MRKSHGLSISFLALMFLLFSQANVVNVDGLSEQDSSMTTITFDGLSTNVGTLYGYVIGENISNQYQSKGVIFSIDERGIV